ncbi:MAG: GHMP kinase [Phycisphaerae bacterium]|jgi:glucuronokinase|nr:GHMP kinase [Phycisphaerae bacterium]
MIIRASSYPRAGLIGNPSDGYFGKTISFAFTNFRAEVMMYHSPELEIIGNVTDHTRFDSFQSLVSDISTYGYYGGVRLLKASLKTFFDYCRRMKIQLDDRNFTVRYSTDIPHGVGLAGSSAIITACFRALMAFYGVSISKATLANLVLSVEVDELGISAGLQDRVVQAYEGLVYMDFDKTIMDRQGYGYYEPLDPSTLPELYIAYRTDLSQCSDVVHNRLRDRYNTGDQEVFDAIDFWAGLADQAKDSLLSGQGDKIGELINANFDMRAKLCKLSDGNVQMVNTARSTGASAKFTGSGGAIVGTCRSQEMLEKLMQQLDESGITVIRPVIASGSTEDSQ